MTVTQAGATLDGLDIRGAVHNNYDGVTVRNSRIRCAKEYDWCLTLGHGSVVQSVEIGGGLDGQTFSTARGIWTGDPTAGNVISRANIHHLMTGIVIDGGTTVADSYIHDGPMGDRTYDGHTGTWRTDLHSGGIMSTRYGNVVIRHNRFEGGNTANLFVQWDVTDSSAPHIGSYLIENNYFTATVHNGQVPTYGSWVQPRGVDGPITVRNNTYTRGWEAGPLSAPTGSSVSGNMYTDGTAAR